MKDEKALFERMDYIIALLEKAGKAPPLFKLIIDGFVTGISILSILSIVETVINWVGGLK